MKNQRKYASDLKLCSTLALVVACGSSADPNSGTDVSDPNSDNSSAQAGAAGGVASAGTAGANGGQSNASAGTGGSNKAGSSGVGGASKGGTSGGGGSGGASAGGTSSGGSMGGAGYPQGPALSCTNLPERGTWQSIAPFTAGGNDFGAGFAEAISVDPFNAGVLWFETGAKGIYKSTDCGGTFTHVNTGRNASTFDRGNHVSMLVDPVDQGVIYVVSIHSSTNLWKTTNGGVDWDPLFPQGSQVAAVANQADAISMDPNDHKHLIIGFHQNCAAPYNPTCEAETTDSGATWRLFKTPNANWEEGAGPWIIDAKTSLYAGGNLWLTTDSGATWKNVTPNGTWSYSGGEVEIHPIPRGLDGTYYVTSGQGLVQSTDGKTWTLMPNFGNRVVGFAQSADVFFMSDQWSSSYYTAKKSAPTTWTKVPPPPALPSDQGAPFIDYDVVHHVLYSSNFAGGLWRTVIE